ncbi:MAG TPA: winged helix-turn-helix domain-containing protein [Verrucomicrobiae bacterium]|nr:winged helix-turn-helix domain-containing protein [Verrucomicrobiae bacterium]
MRIRQDSWAGGIFPGVRCSHVGQLGFRKAASSSCSSLFGKRTAKILSPMTKRIRQAEFTKWMGSVLDALRELGGSARPKQVSDWIAQSLGIPEEQLTVKMKSGTERFHNQVCWARQYLVWEGLLDGSKSVFEKSLFLRRDV